MKICTICKQSLKEISFAKDKSLKCGLTAQCKQCRNLKKKEWEKENKSKIQAYTKKYRKENIERISKDNKIRCKDDYRKNKTKRLTQQQLYKQTHKALVNATNAKRRAQKTLSTPLWVLESEDELNKIKKIYKKCECITKETNIVHHVDHIVPLIGKYVSGFHCAENLQIITRTENLKKGNKHESDNNFI